MRTGREPGHNLEALRLPNTSLELTGVEINPAAYAELAVVPNVHAVHSSFDSFEPGRRFDLVFTCGLLIHIHPEDLKSTYAKIASLTHRYVLFNEYYSPNPVEVSYRGHSGKLFKRDFAGEFLDAQKEFETVAYGFLWKRLEPAWDNSNWTLLRRESVLD